MCIETGWTKRQQNEPLEHDNRIHEGMSHHDINKVFADYLCNAEIVGATEAIERLLLHRRFKILLHLRDNPLVIAKVWEKDASIFVDYTKRPQRCSLPEEKQL